MMSWVQQWVELIDSKRFRAFKYVSYFQKIAKFFLKIFVIPILLTFIYLVELNLLVNNTQLIIAAQNCHNDTHQLELFL